jgi:hypothetical protein
MSCRSRAPPDIGGVQGTRSLYRSPAALHLVIIRFDAAVSR